MRYGPAVLLLVLACGDSGTGPAAPPTVTPALVLGNNHGCRLTPTGAACWGRGTEGQLGRANPPAIGAPAAVEAAPTFVALAAGRAHTCGLAADGTAWCWGANDAGQLGVGAAQMGDCAGVPCAPLPMMVPGLTGLVAIAAGGTTTCALDADGQASCWGRNDLYQLGTTTAPDQCGAYACSRSPVAVAGGHRFRTVSVGSNDHACGLTGSGQALCWGFGRQGQLGHDALVDRSLPVPVAGGHAFRRIAAGGLHTCATDGSERGWCWGIDAIGAGGIPLESRVPVRVAGDARYRTVASARVTSCGLATDGRAWCWGPNVRGEIGAEPVGASQRFDSPTAVNGGRQFGELAGGGYTYCGTDDADRTWCWGDGEEGELGNPAIALSTTPVEVVVE